MGLGLDASAIEAMRRWEKDHQGEAGRHRYALADYGITGDDIREAFASYLDTIGAGT